MAGRVTGCGVAGVLLLSLLAGCEGGEGSGSGERPTLSASFSPSRELPTPTRTPTRTGEPPEQSTEAPVDRPTEEPTTELTQVPTRTPSDEPTDKPTEQPTEVPSETTAPSPSHNHTTEAAPGTAAPDTSAPGIEEPTKAVSQPPTAESSPETASTDEAVPAWVWWLLAAVVVGLGLVAVVLIRRGRRRRGWDEQMRAAEADLAWLARELLPHLLATDSVEQVVGGWQVARPRVIGAEDQLTALESSAADELREARARILRDAARDSRERVDQLRAGQHVTWQSDLEEAITQLTSVL